tara:strand:+ start:471 stop:857 length:387 start_codon:yes stop_codon:yes gene_type:complete
MKQFFAHYETWEDYKAGMFDCTLKGNEQEKTILAAKLLSNEIDFYNSLNGVLLNWPISTRVNLTNLGQNRRAWLGAAGCMYTHKCTEIITRVAWNTLDKETQDKANKVAEKIIYQFENNIKNGKTLFE